MPPTGPVTYQQIIRSYAKGVLDGWSDTDLTPRQRRYCGIALNIASNERAYPYYPPTDQTRDDVIARLHAITFEVRHFLTDAESTDFGIAIERATECLRGM